MQLNLSMIKLCDFKIDVFIFFLKLMLSHLLDGYIVHISFVFIFTLMAIGYFKFLVEAMVRSHETSVALNET